MNFRLSKQHDGICPSFMLRAWEGTRPAEAEPG